MMTNPNADQCPPLEPGAPPPPHKLSLRSDVRLERAYRICIGTSLWWGWSWWWWWWWWWPLSWRWDDGGVGHQKVFWNCFEHWFIDTFNLYSPSMKITHGTGCSILFLVEEMMLILVWMTRMAPKRQDKQSMASGGGSLVHRPTQLFYIRIFFCCFV